MVSRCQGNARKLSGNGPKLSGNGPRWSRNVPECQEMVPKCQEMVHYGQKCSGNVRRCQEIVMKRSKMVRKWSKIVKNGSGWSEMVQKGSRWSKIPKWSKMLEALNKNTFCIHTAWAPKARKLAAKKGKARPSSQFLWFNLFTVFSSFLVVQIIPYGQVDRLFQMDHGAISPSLMVLFSCKEVKTLFISWFNSNVRHKG